MLAGLSITRSNRSRVREIDFARLASWRTYCDHMFDMIYDGGRWHSPRIVPYGPIAIEPGAMTLHYAQTAFEGAKAYRGADGTIRLFRVERNARRFHESCLRMCIPPIPEDDFVEAITALVRLDRQWVPNLGDHALYIRPLVFSTEAHIDLRPSIAYRFIVMTCPVGAYFKTGGGGIALKVEETYARTAPEGGVGATKTAANYATTLFAAEAARKNGFDQILWLDGGAHRFIEEAGLMNVFFKIGGRVVTPSATGAILPGITRDSVIALIRDRNLGLEERPVAIEEIAEAHRGGTLEEIFATGTAAVVLPIARLAWRGANLVPSAPAPGPLTAALYDELAGIQFGRRPDRFGWTTVIGP